VSCEGQPVLLLWLNHRDYNGQFGLEEQEILRNLVGNFIESGHLQNQKMRWQYNFDVDIRELIYDWIELAQNLLKLQTLILGC
jgi:hypothetical protein